MRSSRDMRNLPEICSGKPGQTQASNSLPKILCFHGSGSSGAIFKVQARRLIQLLKDDFEFIFLDAPIESCPGPGMLPIFESAGPFWRWHCSTNASTILDISLEQVRCEREKTRTCLSHILRANHRPDFADCLNSVEESKRRSKDDTSVSSCENKARDRNTIVGVMSFSQGGRVAAGLLAELQGFAEIGQDSPIHQTSLSRHKCLKFAVLFNSTHGPLPLTEDHDQLIFMSSHRKNGNSTSESAQSLENIAQSRDRYDAWLRGCGGKAPHDHVTSGQQLNQSIEERAAVHSAPAGYVCERVNVPSLHVWGKQDPWLSESQKMMAECFASPEVIEVEGGHHLPRTQMDMQKVRDFIMKHYHQ